MRGLVVCCLILGLLAPAAGAFEPFRIEDIRVEGAQRVEQGTIFNYLPVSVGDRLTSQRAAAAIRSLHDTGFFRDITLRRDGNTLVIEVDERATIASLSISGNQAIKTKDLNKALESVGLTQGQFFKEPKLDRMQQELRRQYFSNGHYGIQIDSEVEELDNNRVAVSIEIDEGSTATIEQIKILGNETFPDSVLKDQMTLQPERFWRPLTSSDRYAQEELSGDLEALSSYYQDRGYIDFRVESTQVSLSPDKRDVFITINVSEGARYEVRDVSLAGDLIVPEDELEKLVRVQPGDTFSRGAATRTSERITERLGEEGYAFADVQMVPELDKEDNKVDVTFMVEPGELVFVRNVTFSGNRKTRDYVLRREMRQFESGRIDNSAISRGRTRLNRLPFIENAEVETERVPGTEHLVDVNYSVKERSAGSFQIGLGFSGSQGLILNSSIQHSNFMGTGKRVRLRAERSSFSNVFSLSLTEPFHTRKGVTRTISGFYRQQDSLTNVSSSFNLDTFGGRLRYIIPITEFDSFRLGASFRSSVLGATPFSSASVIDFVERNGDDFNSFTLETGWAHDTRNRTTFPSRGQLQRVTADVTAPIGGLDYFILEYRYLQMLPFHRHVLGQTEIDIAGGGAYDDTSDLPPWEKFFGGGINSVRGFESAELGPQDRFDNPIGGNLSASMQNELLFPTLVGSNNIQVGLFADVGNVWDDANEFDTNDLRASSGVAVRWLTPFLGMLEFSLARTLRKKPGDDTETFTFSLGGGF